MPYAEEMIWRKKTSGMNEDPRGPDPLAHLDVEIDHRQGEAGGRKEVVDRGEREVPLHEAARRQVERVHHHGGPEHQGPPALPAAENARLGQVNSGVAGRAQPVQDRQKRCE